MKFALLLIKRRCEQIFKVTFLESTFLNPAGVGDDERAALDRLGEGDEEGLRAAWEDAQDRAEAAAEEGPDGQRAPAVSSDGKQFSFLFELREKECAYLELSVCLSVCLSGWLAGWLAGCSLACLAVSLCGFSSVTCRLSSRHLTNGPSSVVAEQVPQQASPPDGGGHEGGSGGAHGNATVGGCRCWYA